MSDINEHVAVPICNERMKAMENRIDRVEAITEELRNLTLSVERLTMTVSSMVKESEDHETRIGVLESKDALMWRALVKYLVTAAAGLVLGYAMKNMGF